MIRDQIATLPAWVIGVSALVVFAAALTIINAVEARSKPVVLRIRFSWPRIWRYAVATVLIAFVLTPTGHERDVWTILGETAVLSIAISLIAEAVRL